MHTDEMNSMNGSKIHTPDVEELKAKIKQSIANVARLKPEEIPDRASYVEDLGLDSLSILELLVDVEYQLRIKIPDDEISKIRTVEDTVRLVQHHLFMGAQQA